MTSLQLRHPTDAQLLRYADGELPVREADEVRSHLPACWQCRTELEELQETVGECVRYRKSVLEIHLPPPPAPWGDIRTRFARAGASLVPPSLLDRLAAALRSPLRNPTRWVAAAMVLLLLSAVVYQFRSAPSVRAASLLRKAAAAAESRPSAPRRIQIRTSKRRLTRLIGSPRQVTGVSRAAHADGSDTAALASLEALFNAGPVQAVHGDLWPGNLLQHDQSLRAVDFREAGQGSRAIDVANAFRWMPWRGSPDTARRQWRIWLDAYSAVIPLMLLETRTIPSLACLLEIHWLNVEATAATAGLPDYADRHVYVRDHHNALAAIVRYGLEVSDIR